MNYAIYNTIILIIKSVVVQDFELLPDFLQKQNILSIKKEVN